MSRFSSKLIFCALKQASLECAPKWNTHAIFLGLQITRPAVVGTTFLLELLDSIFCSFIPLILFPKLKPWIAIVILSLLSTSFFKKLIRLSSRVWPSHWTKLVLLYLCHALKTSSNRQDSTSGNNMVAYLSVATPSVSRTLSCVSVLPYREESVTRPPLEFITRVNLRNSLT